jgi:hypothetical protein
MVSFKSAALFLLLVNENVVANDLEARLVGSAEGIANSPVDAETTAASSEGTMDAKSRTEKIANEVKGTPARRAKRRKPISHAYKKHVKPYRKLQEGVTQPDQNCRRE